MWNTIGLQKANKADELARVERATAALAANLRSEFAAAVQRLGDALDLDALATLLESGDIGGALRLVADVTARSGFGSFGSAITNATLSSGRAAAKMIAAVPQIAGVDVRFDVLNPKTVEHVRAYEMRLVREMTAEALSSVRETMQAGVAAGRNPLQIAREVRESIGLTKYQESVVQRYRQQLEKLDPAALDRRLADKRSAGMIRRAINAGKPLPPEKIDDLVSRYRQRWIKYRSETIARAEAMRSHNTGNQMAWRQAVEDGTFGADEVRREWIFTRDSKTRHAHRTIPKLNPDGVGLDEYFKSELGPILYPLDPNAPPENTINCRCTVFIRYRPRPAA